MSIKPIVNGRRPITPCHYVTGELKISATLVAEPLFVIFQFNHRGASSAGSLFRDEATSTGVMLSGPFKASSAHLPKAPPTSFGIKTDVSCNTTQVV